MEIKYKGTSEAVRKFLHANPDRMVTLDELHEGVKHDMPDLPRGKVSICMATLIRQGEFRSAGVGAYTYRSPGTMRNVGKGQKPTKPRTNGAAPTEAVAALDTALAALATAEQALIAVKDDLSKLADLKKLLGNLGIGA